MKRLRGITIRTCFILILNIKKRTNAPNKTKNNMKKIGMKPIKESIEI